MTEPQPELNLRVSQEMFGGVWSNVARVSHSPFEFTIDFARVDFSAPVDARTGVIVARVNMSPLMISQLIEALQTNWQAYAQLAMPREVYGDDSGPDSIQA